MPSQAEQLSYAISTVEVLIVDDNAPTRSLLRSVLRAVGVKRISEAGDAEEALDHLEVRNVDIILLDYAMPGMNGLDLARLLRTDPDRPGGKARIIMITGYGDRRNVAAARDAGVDEFLVKPISTRALLQRLEASLARPREFVDADSFQGPDRRRRKLPPPGQEDRRGGKV